MTESSQESSASHSSDSSADDSRKTERESTETNAAASTLQLDVVSEADENAVDDSSHSEQSHPQKSHSATREDQPVEAKDETSVAETNTEPDQNSSGQPAADAGSTLKKVDALRQKSRTATNRKDLGTAFRHASEAWDAARKHPKDPKLKQATEELAHEIDSLGQQLNEHYGSKIKNTAKRLIEK